MSIESQKQTDSDRNLDYLLDAIDYETSNIPIPEIDIAPHQCDHTADRRCLMHATDYKGIRIAVYQCMDCGQEIEFIDEIKQLR